MISAKTQYLTTDFRLELLQFCHEGGHENPSIEKHQNGKNFEDAAAREWVKFTMERARGKKCPVSLGNIILD